MNETTIPQQAETGDRLLEKHLRNYIAMNLESVFRNPRLAFVGTEVQTGAGRIDILALDRDIQPWIIETKIGIANREAVAQLQSYMAAIADIKEYEGVKAKGILVAEGFDEQCRYALRMVEGISALQYSVAFNFSALANDTSGETGPTSEGPWVVDIERKVFHPRNNKRNVFPVTDRYLVNEFLGTNDIELLADSFSIGLYRKIGGWRIV